MEEIARNIEEENVNQEKALKRAYGTFAKKATIIWLIVLIIQFSLKLIINVTDTAVSYHLVFLMGVIPIQCVGLPYGIFTFPKQYKKTETDKQKLSVSRLLIIFMICLFISIIGNLISLEFAKIFDLENTLESILTNIPLITVFFTTVILAPIMEELFFRKTLLDATEPYGKATAIFMSGLLFGLFHGNFLQFFYAFGLGVILAIVYLQTHRIIYPIVLHMLFNFQGGILPILAQRYEFVVLFEIFQLILILIGLVMLVLTLTRFFNRYKIDRTIDNEIRKQKRRNFFLALTNGWMIVCLVLHAILLALSLL